MVLSEMSSFFIIASASLQLQGFAARIEKLEIEVDALLNEELPVDGASGSASPRSLRALAPNFSSSTLAVFVFRTSGE